MCLLYVPLFLALDELPCVSRADTLPYFVDVLRGLCFCFNRLDPAKDCLLLVRMRDSQLMPHRYVEKQREISAVD